MYIIMNNKRWSEIVDTQFNPADDFFKYVNNKWINENKIPNDMSSWGIFNSLSESNTNKIKDILNSDTLNKNIKILYNGFMNKSGEEYLYKLLNLVINCNNIQDLQKIKNELRLRQLSKNPINYYVYPNINDSENNILYGTPDGLHLPDRDFYIKDDMKEKLTLYMKFMTDFINLVNKSFTINYKLDPIKIVAFEKLLALWSFNKVQKRQPKYYNNHSDLNKKNFVVCNDLNILVL